MDSDSESESVSSTEENIISEASISESDLSDSDDDNIERDGFFKYDPEDEVDDEMLVQMYPFFPEPIFQMRQLDELALLVQENVENGWPRDHIMYQTFKWGLQYALSYAKGTIPETPPILKSFFESMYFHANQKTMNLIRGHGDIGTRKLNCKATFDWKNFNIIIPSLKTIQKNLPPTLKDQGVLKFQLNNALNLAKERSVPFYNDSRATVFLQCIVNDDMAIKPSGQIDKDEVFGTTQKIDVAFTRENPVLKPDAIKNMMYTSVGAVFTSSADGSITLFTEHRFNTNSKTANDVLQETKELQQNLDVCQQCLLNCSGGKENSTVINERPVCCEVEFCKDCHVRMKGDIYTSCDMCEEKGYDNSLLLTRPCNCCLKKDEKCVKFSHLLWSCDGLSIQATAFTALDRDNDSPDTTNMLLPISEMVHMGKKLLRSVSNWWLVLNGYRINAMMIRAIRHSTDKAASAKVHSLISDLALRGRDRMDFSHVLEYCSQPLLGFLNEAGLTTTSIHPDPFWPLKDAIDIKETLDMCTGPYGSLLVLGDGKLVNIRLHHPVETKVLCELPAANSITYTNGVVFACQKGDIIFVDVTGKTAVNLHSMRKAKLCDLAKEEDLIPKSTAEKEYTCKQLRDMLNAKLFQGKETSSSRRRKQILTPNLASVQKEINLRKPVCINSFESGILLCDKEASKLMVFAIEIKPRQVQLKLTQSFDFPHCNHSVLPVSVSCITDENTAQIRKVFVSDGHQDGGVYGFDIESGTWTTLIRNREDCGTIHGICTQENHLLMADRKRNQILKYDFAAKQLEKFGDGKCSTSDGPLSSCSFAQPTAVCAEGSTIFVVDRATNTVRLISSVSALSKYLSVLHAICQSFGIHCKQLGFAKALPLPEVITRMADSLKVLDEMIDLARKVMSKPMLSPEGPEGTPAKATIDQLRLSIRSLRKLSEVIKAMNPDFAVSVDMQSMLTLVVEHHFSVARSRYPMPTPLQYCQMILAVVKESLKKLTAVGFSYFLSQKSFYPVPTSSVKFESLTFPRKQKEKGFIKISPQEKRELRNWWLHNLKGVAQKTPRQRSEKDNPGTLPIAAYAKEPPSISMPVPEEVLLPNFDENDNNTAHMQEDQDPTSATTTTRRTARSKQGRKEQPGHNLNGKYVTTSRTGQIGKVLKVYSDDSTDSALLKIFETTIDDPRVLTYIGDLINPVTDIDVINFQIDEGDEEIRLSEENYSEFITACTGAKRDLDDVNAGELSSDGEKSDDELVFFPTTTRRGRRIVHPFASHSEWL